MAKRLLVTEGGTGASEHLIRSLRSGDDAFVIVACHWDQFFLKNSSADRRWVVPTPSDPGYARAISRIVDREKIDLIVPNADESVAALSASRRRFPGRLLLPRDEVVRQCQDKYALNRLLSRSHVPVPATRALARSGDIGSAFRALGSRSPLWCRIRFGSNSRGAAPVATPEQARSWIRYWSEMRGVPPRDFTLSEYLPGRNFACLMLWKDGTLVLAKTCERLSYFFASSQPSGQSSMAALSKTVREPRVVEVSTQAIRALDARASGVFSVDLKGDEGGEPRITEINAGRLIAQNILLDRSGKHNLTLTYVRLALGEPVTLRDEYDAPVDHYFVRNVDAEPLLFHASEFFQDIEDARSASHARAPRKRGRRADDRAPSVAATSRVRFEITGAFDRHVLEALSLDMQRVGLGMGFAITDFNVKDTAHPVTGAGRARHRRKERR